MYKHWGVASFNLAYVHIINLLKQSGNRGHSKNICILFCTSQKHQIQGQRAGWVFSLSDICKWGFAMRNFKWEKGKTKQRTTLKSPVPSRHHGPHQAQTALAYSPFSPPPPSTESLSDRAAFILAYCISLYASSRWAVNAYTYRQEKTFPT